MKIQDIKISYLRQFTASKKSYLSHSPFARLNGKQIGQREGIHLTTKKSVNAKQIIKTHSKDFGGTLSDDECIKLCGISRNTYYKYKRDLKQGEF